MIKKIFLSLIIVALIIPATAQKLEVTETSYKINKTSQPALMVEMPHISQKTVSKAWAKLMKKEYNAEKVKGKKEILADNAIIKSLSDNTVDVYAKTAEKKDIVSLLVAVDLGGTFLNSAQAEKLAAMKSIVNKFAIDMVKDIMDDQIKDQTKKISTLEKEMKNAEKNKIQLEKEIKSYKKKIENKESEIQALSKNIKKQNEQLESEKKIYHEMKKEGLKIK